MSQEFSWGILPLLSRFDTIAAQASSDRCAASFDGGSANLRVRLGDLRDSPYGWLYCWLENESSHENRRLNQCYILNAGLTQLSLFVGYVSTEIGINSMDLFVEIHTSRHDADLITFRYWDMFWSIASSFETACEKTKTEVEKEKQKLKNKNLLKLRCRSSDE